MSEERKAVEASEVDGSGDSDRSLDNALAALPRHHAPAALQAELRKRWLNGRSERVANPASGGSAITLRISRRAFGGLAIAASVALVAFGFVLARAVHVADASPLVVEAVNDHLRVLRAAHPIEIASGGIHQVKPWFAGKLDFAPVVAFGGDDDFILEGGAVAWFLDRDAATFFFRRRLHAISLFVMRSDGLATNPGTPLESSARGYHVLLWSRGELAYALVSDVDVAELRTLAARLNP